MSTRILRATVGGKSVAIDLADLSPTAAAHAEKVIAEVPDTDLRDVARVLSAAVAQFVEQSELDEAHIDFSIPLTHASITDAHRATGDEVARQMIERSGNPTDALHRACAAWVCTAEKLVHVANRATALALDEWQRHGLAIKNPRLH